MPAAPTLSEKFTARRNNLTVLRLLLAGVVLVVHSQALRTATQPALLRADVGQMAVDGFFVLSGFLVVGSARRLNSVRRFLWHRALRVLPGFWVCLIFTALVVAPVLAVLQGRSPLSVFTGPDSALTYVTRNAFLIIRQWGISGLGTADSEPGAMDGSLWSLYYEGMCYVGVALLVLAGVVRPRIVGGGRHRVGPVRLLAHRRELLAVGSAGIWLTLLVDAFGPALPMHLGRLMIFMFLIGVLAELYAEHIPMDGRIALGAAVLVVTSCGIADEYQLVGAPALGYLLFWLAVAAPVPFQPRNDISYGVYMYHWPVHLLLIWSGVAGAGVAVFTVTSMVLTALLATASWVWIERPAMTLRNVGWVTRPAVRSVRPAPLPLPAASRAA